MHKNKFYLCVKYILYIPSIYAIIIYRKGRKAPNRKEVFKMYEVVKVVNGHEIYRMKGTHGSYWVDIKKGVQRWFKTQKAAASFCETF